MKVKVEYVVEVDENFRRAINEWYGRPGLASRRDVKAWYEANGHSMDDDLIFEQAERDERAEEDLR